LLCAGGFSVHAGESSLLSESEKAWISENPVIKVAAGRNYAPYEFFDETGTYSGIAADYLNYITEKTDLVFRFPSIPNHEAYDMVASGEFDLLCVLEKTGPRMDVFRFSSAYHFFRKAVVVRTDNTEITGFSDLRNYSIAVVSGGILERELGEAGFETVPYTTLSDAFMAVLLGAEDAALGYVGNIQYVMRDMEANLPQNVAKLNTIPLSDSAERIGMHFAASWDMHELVIIIDKVLANMPQSLKDEIYVKWIGETERDITPIYMTVALVLAVVGLLAAISVYWGIKLRAVSRENRRYGLLLRKTEDFNSNIFEISETAYRTLDLRDGSVECGESYGLLFGYAPQNVPKTEAEWDAVIHPEDIRTYTNTLNLVKSGEIEDYSTEWRLKTADGSYKRVADRGRVLPQNKNIKDKSNEKPIKIIGVITLIGDAETVKVQPPPQNEMIWYAAVKDRLGYFAEILKTAAGDGIDPDEEGLKRAFEQSDGGFGAFTEHIRSIREVSVNTGETLIAEEAAVLEAAGRDFADIAVRLPIFYNRLEEMSEQAVRRNRHE
jgi:PAS domain S-box-containing protein